MIGRVKLVNIPVSDQGRALAFYTEKLGFEVARDETFGDRRWLELEIPGANTRITLSPPEVHEDRIGTSTGIVFGAEDIHATYDDLVAKGVVFVKPLAKESWGMRAVFKDEDGNSFMLVAH